MLEGCILEENRFMFLNEMSLTFATTFLGWGNHNQTLDYCNNGLMLDFWIGQKYWNMVIWKNNSICDEQCPLKTFL
jgi:hypothetical protein